MRYLATILQIIAAILALLFFGGQIKIPKLPIPALGQFFHPVNGFWNNGEKVFTAPTLSTVMADGINNESKVIFDERMVPHIFAQNIEDALYMQGYIEAQQRLFQMDFITRAASGRLSEVMGAGANEVILNFDKERNRSQIELAAENAVEGWKKFPEYQLLEKYVTGVNAYIKELQEKDYPIEFKLLGYKPELWTAKKSALVYKYMADVLAGRAIDLESTNSLSLLGKSLFDEMYPELEDGGFPVIPNEKIYNFKNLEASNLPDSIISKTYANKEFKDANEGAGSNNWVLSKSKTASGNVILCNDPHLSLGLPSIWIEEQITTPSFNAYGVSFPGFPGIMIGFNSDVAWGETNVGQDIKDLFEVKWVDSSKSKYWLDGKQVPTKIVVKEINVKGIDKPILDTIRYVNHNVVQFESKNGKSDLAVRWLAADVPLSPEFMTFINLMQSKNYDDYKKALAYFNTPAQNFLFGAKSGDIALTANGKYPIRQKDDGRFIEDGSKSSTDWDAYINRDEIPWIKNPQSGYLTSANQRSASKEYPYYYTGVFEHSRNRIINDTLRQAKKFTTEDMKGLQANSFTAFAKDMKPIILASLGDKHKNESLYQGLARWDGSYKANSKEAVWFEDLFKLIYKNTYDEILIYKDSIDVLEPGDWRLVYLVKNNPKSKIFDIKSTPQLESLNDIIEMSYAEVSSKPTNKTWGDYKPVNIKHYTRIPAFCSDTLRINGHKSAPNALQNDFGPSWRMIVELGDKPKALGVYPGGQSGNPLSKYYKNMIETWASNEYNELLYAMDEKEIKPLSIITFSNPKKK